MENGVHEPPGLGTLVNRFARTGLGALHNRGEIIALEWQEEKGRLVELLVWGFALGFLAMLSLGLLVTTILLLVPPEARVYVAGGLTLLSIGGGIAAWLALKSVLKHEPFPETLAQVKKDAQCFESFR